MAEAVESLPSMFENPEWHPAQQLRHGVQTLGRVAFHRTPNEVPVFMADTNMKFKVMDGSPVDEGASVQTNEAA
jgi:hypothetical protein